MWKEAPAFLTGGKNSVELVLFCLQDMVWDIQYKTVRWSFVESLEPARVVQVRCSSMVNQGNVYGQVTVRMHTRQVESPVCVPPSCFSSLRLGTYLWNYGYSCQDCGFSGKAHCGLPCPFTTPLLLPEVSSAKTGARIVSPTLPSLSFLPPPLPSQKYF